MLSPTQTWKDAANAGTADPVLLVTLKPSILYDDKRLSEDWQGGTDSAGTSLRSSSISGLNQKTPADGEDLIPYANEVRLGSADVTHPEKQDKINDLHKSRGLRMYFNKDYDYSAIPQFVQTFKCESAFRLKKLYLGIRNVEKKDGKETAPYKGKTIVRLYTHISEPSYRRYYLTQNQQKNLSGLGASGEATKGMFDNAREVARIEIDHSLDASGDLVAGTDYDGVWRILDLSDANIWLPGGDILCGIGIHCTESTNAEHLHLFGSESDASYTRGQLFEHDHSTGRSYKVTGDLAFKFIADGYQSTGTGIWLFDIGESLSGYTAPGKTAEVARRLGEADEGVLEITGNEPPGTILEVYMRESATTSFTGAWKRVSDNAALGNKRYIQVKAILKSDTNRLETPRVKSIRCAYRRNFKFTTTSTSLNYPNALLEAPDFSMEGDPLEGTNKASDTSSISLSTAEGMMTRIFQLYPMKNDPITVSLGFNTSAFTETDYLPLKTLWVEGWSISDNWISVRGYDQFTRLKAVDIPGETEPPELMEKIYYVKQTPDVILKDLLLRGAVRWSQINHASFTALATSFPWELSLECADPEAVDKLIAEVNKHLLAFMSVNENGKWQANAANFGSTPTVEIQQAEVLEGSEETDLGIEKLKNQTAIFFNTSGEGKNETEFKNVTIEFDSTSQKANQEALTDKLLSRIIPPETDGGSPSQSPRKIAHRRLAVQKDGLRMTRFSLGLKYAYLQIGDHVYFNSRHYRRAGVSTYNPLLVFITRKEIDANLKAVHFEALILLDYEQAAGSPSTVAAPTGFSVTDDTDGTATWAWTKSTDDDGTNIRHYELAQTVAGVANFSNIKTLIAANGSASYSYPDSDFSELIEYDFAVRAVHINGRKSAWATDLATKITNAAPSAPAIANLRVQLVTGGYRCSVATDTTGAHHYKIYAYYSANKGWELVGQLAAGVGPDKYVEFAPTNPEGSVASGGTIEFRYSVVDKWGKESAPSDLIAITWTPQRPTINSLITLPTGPALVSTGGYPILNWIANGPYGSWSITLKISPATADFDTVHHYEVQRRDDGGTSKVSWNDWQKLADKIIQRNFETNQIEPLTLLYVNKDSNLKAGYYYQYRVRAVTDEGLVSDWSTAQEKQVTEDTTGPDKPTVTVTAMPTSIWLKISEPAQGGGACPDFSHFKIEGNPNAAGWQTLAERHSTVVFIHDLTNGNMSQSWVYRVTAYDHSGNPSTVSDSTTTTPPAKITHDSIVSNTIRSSEILTGTLTGVELSATANLTVGSSNDVVRLSGDDSTYRIWVGHATASSAPFSVTKAGVVTLTNATLKTNPTANERIEITSSPALSFYSNNVERLKMGVVGSGSTIIPYIVLTGVFSSIADETWTLTGTELYAEDGAMLGLPDYANDYNNGISSHSVASIWWDTGTNKLKVRNQGGSTWYTFSPDP